MGFIRARLSLILVLLLSVMGVFAAAVAVKASITMVEKRNWLAGGDTTDSEEVKAAVRAEYPSRLDEYAFYFNGVGEEGQMAYKSEKNSLFVPADIIADRLGGKLAIYSPDDRAEGSFGGVMLHFRLGSSTYRIGNAEIELPAAPIAAKNHILVPWESFAAIKGFSIEEDRENRAVFLNYYSGFDGKEFSEVRLLRLTEGRAAMTDITGANIFWEMTDAAEKGFSYLFSENGYTCVLQAPSGSYLLKYGRRTDPVHIETTEAAGLSRDGKQLYWLDSQDDSLYIYDIDGGSKSGLKGFGDLLRAGGENGDGVALKDYSAAGKSRRLTFALPGPGGDYTLIEQEGKEVLEGYARSSPDMRRILFYRAGKGYYAANRDGGGSVRIGEGFSAEWISNRYIFVSANSGNYIFNVDSGIKEKTGDVWKRVGQTPKGESLYTRGGALYCDSQGGGRPLLELPFAVERVFAGASGGPYILAEPDNGALHFYSGGDIIPLELGEASVAGGESGVVVSPDGKSFVVLLEGDYSSAMLVDSEGNTKTLCLSLPAEAKEDNRPPAVAWINDTSLLLNTEKKGWLIKNAENPCIYGWIEPEGSSIEGVLVK